MVRTVFLPLLLATMMHAQTNEAIVPRLIRLSGTVTAAAGSSQSKTIGVVFALYKEESGGSPLWLEVQNVNPDSSGHYSVLLGSSQPEGLPGDLFSSNEARWLGVKPAGQDELPRVLLVSVPYALKAGDADTIGGLPPSAFVQANISGANSLAMANSRNAGPTPLLLNTGTSAGAANQIAKWVDPSTLGNSLLFDNGTNVGINTLNPQSTLDVNGEAIFRSFSTLYTTTNTFGPVFQFTNAAKPTAASWTFGVPGYANATAFFIYDYANQNAPFTLEQGSGANSLYFKKGGNVGVGTSGPTSKLTVTGTIESTSGGIKFPDGSIQASAAALGATQSGITAVTAGMGLVGGGTTGTLSLALDQTFTDGRYALLTGGNGLTGNQVVSGNVSVNGNVSATGGVSGNAINSTTQYSIGGNAVLSASSSSQNVFLGLGAGNSNSNGISNVFSGFNSGYSSVSGNSDTFVGKASGYSTNSGYNNSFLGDSAGYSNTAGFDNTFLGFQAGYSNLVGQHNTYVGETAGYSNTGDQNVYLGSGSGTGVTSESNTMRLGGSSITSTYMAGVAGANIGSSGVAVMVDSTGKLGVTTSSRRFKDHIVNMGDTSGLFRLRPVLFYYKPEIEQNVHRSVQYGLIAEEVAKVFPDLVVYDKEGKPYTVKYQYLTPMLLNEVKKQHSIISAQEKEIQTLQRQNEEIQERLERLERSLTVAQK